MSNIKVRKEKSASSNMLRLIDRSIQIRAIVAMTRDQKSCGAHFSCDFMREVKTDKKFREMMSGSSEGTLCVLMPD